MSGWILPVRIQRQIAPVGTVVLIGTLVSIFARRQLLDLDKTPKGRDYSRFSVRRVFVGCVPPCVEPATVSGVGDLEYVRVLSIQA